MRSFLFYMKNLHKIGYISPWLNDPEFRLMVAGWFETAYVPTAERRLKIYKNKLYYHDLFEWKDITDLLADKGWVNQWITNARRENVEFNIDMVIIVK